MTTATTPGSAFAFEVSIPGSARADGPRTGTSRGPPPRPRPPPRPPRRPARPPPPRAGGPPSSRRPPSLPRGPTPLAPPGPRARPPPPPAPPVSSRGGGGAGGGAPPPGGREPKGAPWVKVVSVAISVLLVVGIFVFAIPRIASYGEVLDTLRDLRGSSLVLAARDLLQSVHVLAREHGRAPGLQLSRAAVITQTTTTVANTLPAGGAVAVSLTFEMLHSWGFTTNAATLYVLVTGFWNIFMKLALPVLSVAILALTGQSSAVFLVAAVIGVVVLTIAIGVFAAILWKEHLASRIGDLAGRLIAAVLKPFRRRAPRGLGERAVRFRRDTIGLIERRWLALTVTTAAASWRCSSCCCCRSGMSVSPRRRSRTAQLLAVFAFGRLLSDGADHAGRPQVIELGYIGGLVAAGGAQPDVVAGVLLFRVLTYGIQIPIGGVTYLIWRRKRSWRRPVPSRSVPDEGLSEARPLAPWTLRLGPRSRTGAARSRSCEDPSGGPWNSATR